MERALSNGLDMDCSLGNSEDRFTVAVSRSFSAIFASMSVFDNVSALDETFPIAGWMYSGRVAGWWVILPHACPTTAISTTQ